MLILCVGQRLSGRSLPTGDGTAWLRGANLFTWGQGCLADPYTPGLAWRRTNCTAAGRPRGARSAEEGPNEWPLRETAPPRGPCWLRKPDTNCRKGASRPHRPSCSRRAGRPQMKRQAAPSLPRPRPLLPSLSPSLPRPLPLAHHPPPPAGSDRPVGGVRSVETPGLAPAKSTNLGPLSRTPAVQSGPPIRGPPQSTYAPGRGAGATSLGAPADFIQRPMGGFGTEVPRRARRKQGAAGGPRAESRRGPARGSETDSMNRVPRQRACQARPRPGLPGRRALG